MFRKLKFYFYFYAAAYFRIWAKIRLKRWNPEIILITGSTGKTTQLHLIESQLQSLAKYSHNANSSFGISFDILNLHRVEFNITEWLYLFLAAPLKTFQSLPDQRLYVVEADCDRPGEGKFISSFIKPKTIIWLTLSKTHSVNFDKMLKTRKNLPVEAVIADEFGFYLQSTTAQAYLNTQNIWIKRQIPKTISNVIELDQSLLENYKVSTEGTYFKISGEEYYLQHLLPMQAWMSVYIAADIAKKYTKDPDLRFTRLTMPPGRSSIYKGIKNTIIIDSSYNASLSADIAVIEMTDKIDHSPKWYVISDILELGMEEEEEHTNLVKVLAESTADKIILMGPRTATYTYPRLVDLNTPKEVLSFSTPLEVKNYLLNNLHGGELVLFKGARFLEGIIESMLQNKEDSLKLARREQIWQRRRGKWGL